MTTRRTNSDFDPEKLTQRADEHTKALEELQKRVGTNENFGKTFKSSSTDSKSIDEAVEITVIKLLKSNTDTQDAVIDIVRKIDGRDTKKQLFGLGKIGLWIVSIIVTILITTWVTSIVKDANTKAGSSNNASSSTTGTSH